MRTEFVLPEVAGVGGGRSDAAHVKGVLSYVLNAAAHQLRGAVMRASGEDVESEASSSPLELLLALQAQEQLAHVGATITLLTLEVLSTDEFLLTLLKYVLLVIVFSSPFTSRLDSAVLNTVKIGEDDYYVCTVHVPNKYSNMLVFIRQAPILGKIPIPVSSFNCTLPLPLAIALS